MRYLRNENTDPYVNMAFDEYALEQLPLDEPLFYLWQNRPAVIIGLNQDAHAEVDIKYLKEHDIALVRRVTGGGAVYHDMGNLNYTIVGRSADLNRDYPEYARYMLQALQTLGVRAELSGRNDILVNGRKVSGYAKRVYKDRLMVHGTLMYDVDLGILEKALNPPAEKLVAKGIASVRSRVMNLRECMPQVKDIKDLKERLERYLSHDYANAEYMLTEEAKQAIEQAAKRKFATQEWIYGKRAPIARNSDKDAYMSINRASRLACGKVEIELEIRDGHIAACRFGGDFIGNLPITAMEQALCRVRYERQALRQRLIPIGVTDYLDGTDVDELLELLCP